MRIPVVGNVSTKDGSSNKNARMTNVLAEEKQGKSFAAVRPGLSQFATGSGDGNNLVCFNGNLINIYGNTVYQAVPSGGTGAEYSINYLPVADHWNHVIWNGSKFCAVGNTYSATSEDGLTWEYGSMPFNAWWGSVAWNGTIFCAVMWGLSGSSPYVHAGATSTDGLTWTARELPTTDEEDENGNSHIASNGTLFVTAAYDAGANFYTSTDGITWTARTAPASFAGYGGLFAYGGGTFVALNAHLGTTYATTSTDGIIWTAATTPSITLPGSTNYAKLVFINGLFVAINSTQFQYSTDGITWNVNSYGSTIWSGAIEWDGEKYVIFGSEPVAGGADCSMLSSSDGVTWEESSIPEGWMFSAASNGTNIVVVGTAESYVTTDIHLINIADPTYTLESIGTMTDGYFDFALIP